jgi:hypothetical protein
MQKPAPDALLLLAPGCAHCPVVLEGLSRLLKQGRLARLEAVNITEYPQAAQAVGTRSVPWTRIGPFELEGALTPTELTRWVELADSGQGFADYYLHLLETRRPHKVSEQIKQYPESLPQLIGLLADEATPMSARIGVGVVMEELAGDPVLLQGLATLTSLAESGQANVRADATHMLGLIGHPNAEPPVRQRLDDPDPNVREIAQEALQMLHNETDHG